MVTDIGCIGIIDRQFKAHTVHGLHGRSTALATGISMGLTTRKEDHRFIGDGGATIGLQHILEAAHRNVNMTVLVHNNMLYGMTGGQPSGLTPCGFKTSTMPDGRPDGGMDICSWPTAPALPAQEGSTPWEILPMPLKRLSLCPGFHFLRRWRYAPATA